MIPYIGKMAVERKRWLEESTFLDGVALCQTIPGATAMQVSAYVGLRVRGIPGAAMSFIGFGLPAFLLMMALSALYATRHTLPIVISVFSGLQAIIIAMVANAAVSFGRVSLRNYGDIIFAIAAAAMFWAGISPILVILLAAFAGSMLYKKKPPPSLIADAGKKSLSGTPLLLLLFVPAIGLVSLFLADRRLFDLAVLLLRIDLFAFGGGFASVPLMFHEVVEVRSWMDDATFLNGIALGQVTPGPIVITATFIGYLLHGPVGGIVATVSVFLPSFLVLVGVAPYFDRLRRSAFFTEAVAGIMCSFVGLLLTVTFRFALNIPWDLARALLASAALIALFLQAELLWVVLIGAGISMLAL